MPTIPSPPSKEQLERERIRDERNKIIEGMDPDAGGPNESETERLRKLQEEEDRLDGKPPPEPEDPNEPWSDPDDDTDSSTETSSSQGGNQDDHPGGPEEMPGSDVVTGKGQAQMPVRHAMPTLHDAVAHRLGCVIDDADVMKSVVSDPGPGARFAGETDVVHPGDVHPPCPRNHDLPGRGGDPRTAGAVDPPADDDDPRP